MFSTTHLLHRNSNKTQNRVKNCMFLAIPSRPERPSGTLQNRTFDWLLAMILPAVGDTKY